MTFYTCLDNKGDVIARCQTKEDVAVLQRMGRPIAEVKAMRKEAAVVCRLTGSPSDYNEDYCALVGSLSLFDSVVVDAAPVGIRSAADG